MIKALSVDVEKPDAWTQIKDDSYIERILEEIKEGVEKEKLNVVDIARVPLSHNDDSANHLSQLEEQQSLLNQLWVLNAGLEELMTLIQLNEIDGALETVKSLAIHVQDFIHNHPRALISFELSHRFKAGRRLLDELVTRLWNNSIRIELKTDYALLHLSDDTYTPAQLVYKYSVTSVTKPFLQNLGTVFRKLTENKIEKVEKVSDLSSSNKTNLRITYGATQSISQLVSVTKSILESLVPLLNGYPDYVLEVLELYGKQLVDDLVCKSLPMLLMEQMSNCRVQKSDVDQLLELQEVMSEIGWYKGSVLTDFINAFDESISRCQLGKKLNELRLVLHGSYEPAGDDDEDWGEWGEEPIEETPDYFRAITQYVQSDDHKNINLLLCMVRALAPVYYSNHQWVMCAHLEKLVTMLASDNKVPEEDVALMCEFNNASIARLTTAELSRLDAVLKNLIHTPKTVAEVEPSDVDTLKDFISKVSVLLNQDAPQLHDRVMAQLVEHVASFVLEQIVSLPDISEEASKRLHTLATCIYSMGSLVDDTVHEIPSLPKLGRLAQILDSNLSTIHALYTQHKLVDFSEQELVSLIEALFVDSTKRRELIASIH